MGHSRRLSDNAKKESNVEFGRIVVDFLRHTHYNTTVDDIAFPYIGGAYGKPGFG